MAEEAPELHPETLAQFEALEKVRPVTRPEQPGSSRGRVDTSTLLPVDDQLLSPAERGRSRASVGGAPRWLEHNVVLWVVGVLGAAALGLLALLILKMLRML